MVYSSSKQKFPLFSPEFFETVQIDVNPQEEETTAIVVENTETTQAKPDQMNLPGCLAIVTWYSGLK